jgi:hypothetical protein
MLLERVDNQVRKLARLLIDMKTSTTSYTRMELEYEHIHVLSHGRTRNAASSPSSAKPQLPM